MEGRYYHIDLAELHRLWVEGMYVNDIAEHFGVTTSVIYSVQRKYKLPPRGRVCRDNVPDPTPEEIRARKREVRRKHFAMKRAEA